VAPIFQSETATLEKHSAKSKMSNKMSAENKANEIDFTICKIILKKRQQFIAKITSAGVYEYVHFVLFNDMPFVQS
jgi:hypothetical protein